MAAIRLAMNKKRFDRLGDLLLAAIVVLALYGGYVVIRTKALNADAAAYSEQAIRAMVDPWNADAFLRRAAPETKQRVGDRFMTDLFAWYAGLGKLEALDKPAGRVGVGAFPGTAIREMWAAYSAHAQFEAGPAEISVLLKREADAWQVAEVRIESEAFSRMRPPPQHEGDVPPTPKRK